MIDRLIPYSAEAYQGLFTYYYQAISPLHIMALGIGFYLVVLLARHSSRGPIIAKLIIAVLWIWNGVVFHGQYLIDLNWAAEYFGYAFIAQGLMIGTHAYINRTNNYRPDAIIRAIGCGLVIFGMIFSPTIAAIAETPISQTHLFGITPLPMIMASLGAILVIYAKPPIWLFVIPISWAIWEALTAQSLGLWVDLAFACILIVSVIGIITYTRRATP